MPMIVSGLDPQVRMNAYLAGQQFQQEIQRRKQAAEIATNEQNARLRAEISQAMLRRQNAQAKALEDANARAQMGDVRAMQQQNLERIAQGLPPEQRQLNEAIKLGESIENPEARKLYMSEMDKMLAEQREQKEIKAAEDTIATAAKDGYVDAKDMEARRAAGESPKVLARESAEARQKGIAASVATGESANYLAKADALISTVDPESDLANRMNFIYAAFNGSETAKGTPGAGKKMYAQLENLVNADRRVKDLESEPRPFWEAAMGAVGIDADTGHWGGPMIGGPEGPQEPVKGDHKTMKRWQTIQGILSEASNEDDFMSKLEGAKIPLTAELARRIAEMRQSAPAAQP